jgi:hypothetical protein
VLSGGMDHSVLVLGAPSRRASGSASVSAGTHPAAARRKETEGLAAAVDSRTTSSVRAIGAGPSCWTSWMVPSPC